MTKYILHTFYGVFFFPGNFVVFWQKNWENFRKFCFPRVNCTNGASVFKVFAKFFISKIWKDKKTLVVIVPLPLLFCAEKISPNTIGHKLQTSVGGLVKCFFSQICNVDPLAIFGVLLLGTSWSNTWRPINLLRRWCFQAITWTIMNVSGYLLLNVSGYHFKWYPDWKLDYWRELNGENLPRKRILNIETGVR